MSISIIRKIRIRLLTLKLSVLFRFSRRELRKSNQTQKCAEDITAIVEYYQKLADNSVYSAWLWLCNNKEDKLAVKADYEKQSMESYQKFLRIENEISKIMKEITYLSDC